MKPICKFLLAPALFCLGGVAPIFAQMSPLLPSEKAPLSDRYVAYQIEAKYDAKNHSLDAAETLTWTNYTGQPQDHLPFHLYLNAFQPKSTFTREGYIGGNRDVKIGAKWEDRKFGEDVIKSFEVVGMGDLTGNLRFIHPDDDNAEDKTVLEVQLPRPVAPNEKITFKILFHDQFPEVVARSGYKRDFLLAGQWFPKIGVWWKNAWNCHQYHATTEFFADFGTFDVKVTVPSHYNVGATGVQVAENTNADGTKTVEYKAEDVHDFAWTTDPSTKIVEDTVTISSGTVKIRLIMQPGHMASAPRYMDALKGTMKKFDEWIGPYPYSQITVVDPPHGGGPAGGMEYPTFITADTTWWMWDGLKVPEVVVEHEFGHQYWYGMVATNEFEEAWLDEGINQYTECKIMDALYGRDVDFLNTRVATASERGVDHAVYLGLADLDPITRYGWKFIDSNSYSGITYSKTALMLLTLEHIIGEQKVREAQHVYFERYRFKHPTGDDFMNTVNEVAGQNLDWYWNQAVRGTQILDYRILSASSDRADWADKNAPKREKKGETEYISSVVVHRKGDFIMPVTLEVKFDDGETVRDSWDGVDRWHRYTWQKKAKLVSAEIDPDHAIWLDHDVFNNSWLHDGDGHATGKIAGYWMVATQWFAQFLSWLA
ncbi:MAG TPA: M1 family metallopeptidase [Candidatus Acidoferrum sp.]|nr:M1 family metallopeptidase [Candidatus Acidoferrum sp.]